LKPAPFDYVAPTRLEDALAALERHGEDARILAGGQSLVPMMNFRLVRPGCIVDINRIPGLSYIRAEDGRLHIGAMTRQRELEQSALVRDRNGLLFEGVRLIGHQATRTRGTVGGSIVHADPTAELPAMLAALDGEVRVAGPGGTRTIGWRDLFVTYFTTSIQPGEICEEVIVPVLRHDAGWAFEEFTRRHGDFALVGVAAILEDDGDGRCARARLALAGVGPTPFRALRAEEFLTGRPLTPAVLDEAGQFVAEEVDPEPDLQASVAYRRHLAGVLTTRALSRASRASRASGASGGS
jgi:CO/xanthine dehydrogenase FAD-binding subunit